MVEKLTRSLQESIITLLAVDNEEGKIAAGVVNSKQFDEAYRDIVDRILAYRKKHGKAPGKVHLDDLVDDIIGDERNKKHKTYIRILDGIISNADSLNTKYVLSRVQDFNRRQELKGALLEASALYESSVTKEDFVENIEAILNKALKPKVDMLERGVYLGDRKRALGFLETTKADYLTGIQALDDRNFGPTRGTLMMFMAPKGGGKSWFCVHIGKMCLMQNAKVLHVSLEMSEDRVIQRYQQSFHGIGKRYGERYKITQVEFGDGDKIDRFRLRRRKIKKGLDTGSKIRSYLKDKMKTWGSRMDRLHIKGFASRSLTVPKLEAYLDSLEIHDNFIPDVLILDYPDEMKIPMKDYRLSLGATISDIRGLCYRRHICGVAPTQTNRTGWDASTIKGKMVGEDASKFMIADMVAIQNKSPFEKQMGLCRLYVEKNRDDEDDFTVILTQNLRTGQYVLDSFRMAPKSNYLDLIKPAPDEEEEEEEDGDA